ncbi:hypothetical protein [Bacteroides sp.]
MKKIFLPLLALVALASCTQNDMDLKGSDDGQVEIKLSSAVGSVAQTRTSYDETTGTFTNPFVATVLVSKAANLYPSGNLLNASAYKVSFADDTTPAGFQDAAGTVTPAYYPANGDKVYLWGLYPYGDCVFSPATASAGQWQIASGVASTATFTFTGKEDVMTAAEIDSDKSEAAVAVNYTNTKLNFKHLLTKLVVKAKGDAAAATAFGKITDITLVGISTATIPTPSNIANKVSIALAQDGTLATAATITFAGAEASFPFYAYDVVTTPAAPTQLDDAFVGLTAATTPAAIDVPDAATYTTGQTIAYSMVQPITNVTAGAVAYLLNIKTEKGEASGFNVPVVLKDATTPTAADFAGSTASKTFNIQLTFKAAEIKSIVAIGAWDPQGDFEYDIQ